MPVALQLLIFCLAAAVSLATSYLLVTRLERIGERLGLSEALLGMVAALAADAPEITSAAAALAQHQQKVGAGVIIGSNVFNLAALLGLGGVVAGSIALHRRVVALSGVIALWVAVVCLVTTTGTIPPAAGLVAVLAVLVPYLILLGAGAWPAPRAGGAPLGTLAGRGDLRGGTGTRGDHPPAARPAPGRPAGRGRAGRGRRGQRGHGAVRHVDRDAFRGTADHHRRRGAGRGDQPAERGRGRVPGRARARRRHAQHHAEQQRAQRHRRAAAARDDHRAGRAVSSRGAHRGLVPGPDRRRARLRLPGRRGAPGHGGLHHRVLPGLPRIFAGHRTFSRSRARAHRGPAAGHRAGRAGRAGPAPWPAWRGGRGGWRGGRTGWRGRAAGWRGGGPGGGAGGQVAGRPDRVAGRPDRVAGRPDRRGGAAGPGGGAAGPGGGAAGLRSGAAGPGSRAAGRPGRVPGRAPMRAPGRAPVRGSAVSRGTTRPPGPARPRTRTGRRRPG